MIRCILAAMAAAVLLCAPAGAQRLTAIPLASSVAPSDQVVALHGTGCNTATDPCVMDRVTMAQIAAYLAQDSAIAGTYQLADPDLTAIAQGAPTTAAGRALLTYPSIAAILSALGVTPTGTDTTYLYRGNNLSDLQSASAARVNIGLGLVNNTPDASKVVASAAKLTSSTIVNGISVDWSAPSYTIPAVDSVTPRVPATLTINTTAPLAGGGPLNGPLTLTIGAASASAPGTMSALDKAKLDGIAAGATANTGTVTTVSASGTNGVSASVAAAGTAPAITIGLGAITPTSVASTGTISGTTGTFSGALSGSNFSGSSSGTNTGDQTTITGNAGTATKLATARTINGVAFDGTAAITINAVDATTRLAAANNLSDVATPATARTNIGAAASGANLDITSITGSAAKWTTARTVSFTGDATGSGSVDGSANVATGLTLATSGVTAGTYGGANGSASITFDAKGRATAASTATLGVAGGGTGATTASGARAGISAAASGANSDITSLTGLTTPLSIPQGGTGATTAAAAQTSLGLGAAATQSYVEGTFVPVLQFGGSAAGFTYSTQIARYTRIGRTVTVDLDIVLTAKGTGTGNVTVAGLPYTSAATYTGGIATVMAKGFSGITGVVTTYVSAGSTSVNIFFTGNGTYGSVVDTNVLSYAEMYVTFTYSI